MDKKDLIYYFKLTIIGTMLFLLVGVIPAKTTSITIQDKTLLHPQIQVHKTQKY